jgi:hypothetical protein
MDVCRPPLALGVISSGLPGPQGRASACLSANSSQIPRPSVSFARSEPSAVLHQQIRLLVGQPDEHLSSRCVPGQRLRLGQVLPFGFSEIAHGRLGRCGSAGGRWRHSPDRDADSSGDGDRERNARLCDLSWRWRRILEGAPHAHPAIGDIYVVGVDINGHGQIVADGFDSRTSEFHAYLLTPVSVAEPGISLAIEKHAWLTGQGAVAIIVHIVCGPFDGVEDFQEAVAGAFQEKTGAEAEGGLDGTVVCDGIERTHTARLSSFTEAVFKREPAGANVSLFVCTLIGNASVQSRPVEVRPTRWFHIR